MIVFEVLWRNLSKPLRSLSFALLGILFAVVAPAAFAVEWSGEPTPWKGYEKFSFKVDGLPCHVVVPRKPAWGKPWVWRARFPDFHSEADGVLLERGFHIAYMKTDGMFGSPRAMVHWDRFYDFMVKQGMSKKVTLEAVSRGGLFVYRWAARHPERVSCIYADTPVCDFKSWPLGQGSGRGHERSWKNLLLQYDLSQSQALEYSENPVDVLKPIAAAKIPLLHIVSLNDKVVPPAENTFVLAKRYRKLGGTIDIIEVKQGTAKSDGHHFNHPDPVRVADFIEQHSLLGNTEKEMPLSTHEPFPRSNLPRAEDCLNITR